MRRALEMTVIEGIHTSVPMHLKILADEDFQQARISTAFMERFLAAPPAGGLMPPPAAAAGRRPPSSAGRSRPGSTPSSMPTSRRVPAGTCPTWRTPTCRRACGCCRCAPRTPRPATCCVDRDHRPTGRRRLGHRQRPRRHRAGRRHAPRPSRAGRPAGAEARALLGPDAVIGLSTHTPAQIDAACALPLDYLAVGPVFGTQTKATGYDAVGLAGVVEAHAAAHGGGRAGGGHRRHHARHGGRRSSLPGPIVGGGHHGSAARRPTRGARARAYVERLGRV